MVYDSKSFEIQRWHTIEYVESWIANQEGEEGRKLLRRKLVSLLPFEAEDSIRILDLGAGGGALSQEILSVFPKSHIVCQDFSEVMLGHAKQHLIQYTNQVSFVQSDLSTVDWAKPISGKFEGVVSSLVMHTVPSHIREIYGKVYDLVKPGGCFVFADTAISPEPVMEKVYLRIRLKTLQAAMKAETGIEKSLEDIEMELNEKRQSRDKDAPKRVRNPLRKTLTLINHLEWLREAGFSEVDCFWKDMQRAIIGGFRHEK